jgi:hypothetical protein
VSTDVVPAGEMDTGLDDLTPGDLIVPRLRIKHKEGVFEDAGTGEQMGKLICIVLGLVRQRVLFHHDVEDGDVPMCKSPDYQFGYPNLDPEKKNKGFPWNLARLNPNDFPPDQDGLVTLSCESCFLQQWGSHPGGNKPYCSEQHTLPIFYAGSFEELVAGHYSPALVTFQKTGIPPSKRYLGTFKQRNIGAYTKVTEIGLNQQKRGQTDYCVPTFKSIGDTDKDEWPAYSEQYAGIRLFLTTSRPNSVLPDDEDRSVQVTTSTATTATAASPAATPGTQANVPTVSADDQLPF